LRRTPHQLIRYELDGKVITEDQAFEQVESAAIVIVLWMVALLAGVVALQHMVPELYSTGDILFEITSALSNVGLSLGITHPDLPWGAKLTLILCMWVGRLEIVPVVLLLTSLVFYREQ
jgi:trk system potassium uptake protein TrkH